MSYKITLYHYTDGSGATDIANSAGMIEGSPKQNRGYVYGVYFTSSDPGNDPETILLNTYDYTGRVTYSERLWKKIDWVIEVEMDENEVEKVFGVSNGDVYFYEGDVHLNNYQCSIYKNPFKTLYHYTDKAGADGIKMSNVIKGSTVETPKQSRRHGCGVYFTSIDPSNDPKKILLNNYDDAGQVVNSKKLWAKIDWVIKIKMEDYENEFEKVSGVSNRDVYLYEGDVHLNNYQYSIYKNPNT